MLWPKVTGDVLLDLLAPALSCLSLHQCDPLQKNQARPWHWSFLSLAPNAHIPSNQAFTPRGYKHFL